MFCKNCGKEIEDTDKFCPYCGDKTDDMMDDSEIDCDHDEEDLEEESEEKKDKKSTKQYVGIVVGVLILAIVIGFAGVKYLDHQGDKALEASIEKQEKDDAAKKEEQEKRDAARQKDKDEEAKKEKERIEENTKREEEKKKLEEEEKVDQEKTKVDASEEYILPKADVKYYSESEIDALSAEQVFYARNEIYARHGRRFELASLNQYFRSKKWYNPTIDPDQFDALGDSLFNDFEIKNRDALLERENELKNNE